MLLLQLGMINSLAAARVKASEKAVQGVRQSGVMADLLNAVLVVRYSPDDHCQSAPECAVCT